ncbi:hypothetical protein TTHERM_01108520 (macronuclear) [Tetrahymena thermophila SB210]|uniref:Uncharacterized protein n=1 Tax=Tetrahymena thermophila (strain SB210) TaxID=312017 RepID=Q22BA3_TETTS|nr:hypothetical protein TTHERM_01108520 [Tetrahymena thermophila SB210]EAR82550.3 hypothetical protein TTHERM_01108520 [Tetrahymena thermophila SB210]|eukprot:XP_001030213.3 hypothetical protein TTHERM_01108520 [Tetrahymena thermophila SB210]
MSKIVVVPQMRTNRKKIISNGTKNLQLNEDMIGLYDISTHFNSNNLSTKTGIRSQGSSEEMDSWLEQNIHGNKAVVRQQRIQSVNQQNQQQYQVATQFKKHLNNNNNNMDYYSNARGSQSTKNSSFSFIFDDQSCFSNSKAETSRQMLSTEYKQKEQNGQNGSDAKLTKYENEFLDINSNNNTYLRSRVTSKEYSFPIILAKEKLEEGSKNQPYNKSKQFYDQTSSQPLNQANIQRDEVVYQSQPQIHQLIDKQQQNPQTQNGKQRANISSYQNKRIDYLEHNQIETNNNNNQSPKIEPQSSQKVVVEPNKNNRIRSQIYQKKRQQFENIFINEMQTQKKEFQNTNNFSIIDREAYIDGEQVKSNNTSPKSTQNKVQNTQQAFLKPTRAEVTNNNLQKKQTPTNIINSNKISQPYISNLPEQQTKSKDNQNAEISLSSTNTNQERFQFEQENFEEMHFFQVEFLQKCKSWMKQLENKF